MFNFNHLYYFYVTARLSGVTAAAKHLNTSQPSVTAQLKSLEAALGRKLFRKKGRQLELTDEGWRIYHHCQRMFEVAEELEAELKNPRFAARKSFTVGVNSEVDRPFLTDTIAQYLKDGDDGRASVTMRTGSADELLKELELGQIDLVISNTPLYGRDLEIRATLAMPVVFAGSPALLSRLQIGREATVNEALRKAARVLALPSPQLRLRQETDLYLQRKKIPFAAIFESDIVGPLIRSMVDSIAVGLVPRNYIQKELRENQLRVVGPKDGLWIHQLYVIVSQTPHAARFIDDVIALLDKENKDLQLHS